MNREPSEILRNYWLEDVEGENFLVHKRSMNISSLNPMGAVFVELLRSGMKPDELANCVSQQLSVDRDVVERDFRAMFETLEDPDIEDEADSYDRPGWLDLEQFEPVWQSNWTREQYLMNNCLFRFDLPDESVHRLIHNHFGQLSVQHLTQEPQAIWRVSVLRGKTGIGIYINDELQAAVSDIDYLDVHLKQILVDRSCEHLVSWLNIHAAAVLNTDAEAVVFIAPSGHGKSTLATRLGLAGYPFLGDDVLVLNLENREIVPFPFAANLKPGAWSLFEACVPEVAALPVQRPELRPVKYLALPVRKDVLRRSFPVKAIIFPEYHSEADSNFTPVSKSAVFELLNEARLYIHPKMTRSVSRGLIGLVRHAPAYSMQYNSYGQALRLLTQHKFLP